MMPTLSIAIVAGALPNFMKIAPIVRALRLLPQEKILGLVRNRHKLMKKDATYYPKYYPKSEASPSSLCLSVKIVTA